MCHFLPSKMFSCVITLGLWNKKRHYNWAGKLFPFCSWEKEGMKSFPIWATHHSDGGLGGKPSPTSCKGSDTGPPSPPAPAGATEHLRGCWGLRCPKALLHASTLWGLKQWNIYLVIRPCPSDQMAALAWIQFSFSVMSNSLWLQYARLTCPLPTPGDYLNSCPSSWWCHPNISSSVFPFSSCPQTSPASGSFQMSELFTSGGQSVRVSASISVLPMNIQNWFPLGWTGWISLLSKGLSRIFSNTTVQKHQFFSTQLSL